MGRYEDMFQSIREEKRGAFVPFTVIGDPSLEASVDIIKALVSGGADALELGIPFSDPVADGPTIQSAGVRALDAGVTPKGCFEVLRAIRTVSTTNKKKISSARLNLSDDLMDRRNAGHLRSHECARWPKDTMHNRDIAGQHIRELGQKERGAQVLHQ